MWRVKGGKDEWCNVFVLPKEATELMRSRCPRGHISSTSPLWVPENDSHVDRVRLPTRQERPRLQLLHRLDPHPHDDVALHYTYITNSIYDFFSLIVSNCHLVQLHPFFFVLFLKKKIWIFSISINFSNIY